jgi:hypothetical protein
VAADRLAPATSGQLRLLPSSAEEERSRALNRALDELRERFGPGALVRGQPGPSRAGLSLGVKRGEE